MKGLPRTATAGLLALAAALAPLSQAAASPAQGGGRGHVYVTHRAPAPPLGACLAPSDSDGASAFALGSWRIGSPLNVTLSTQGVPSSVGSSAFRTALTRAIGEWEGTQLPNSALAA